MTTEKKQLRIRAATALDAVNLYQLLVAEEQKTDTELSHDPAARIAHILNVIETGHALVAEKSGRIVGSVGFAAGAPPYATENFLVSDWLFLLPSLRNTDLGRRITQAFLKKLIAFADLKAVQTRLFLPAVAKFGTLIESQGFKVAGTLYTREPGMIDNAAKEPVSDEAESAAEPAGPAGPEAAAEH